MADQIVPWCYYGFAREPRDSIGVARYIEKRGRPASTVGRSYPGWCYTTDQGFPYVGRVARYLAEQTDSLGKPLICGQPTGGTAGVPVGLNPRSVTVHCLETMKTRQVVVYSTDAPLWTDAAEVPVLLQSHVESSGRYVTVQGIWAGNRARSRI
jgi:hypothetical protein